MRHLAVLFLILLTACAERGVITLLPEAADIGHVRTVYFGTTRQTNPETGTFDTKRLRKAVSYGRYDISIPPDRKVGKIAWPKRGAAPDPRTDFLTTQEDLFDDAGAFRANLAGALRENQRGQRDVTVFIHGFNNTFAEGMYRIAQMANDLDLPGVTVHYAWPSAGNPLGYVYDRDSALFARDGLERLLSEVAGAGADRIVVVAHSMGAALTMETLRQISIRGDKRVMGRIAGVVLISPDIDVDVFHEQATAIGTLPQPFIIFSSKRDRALALSARLTGQRDRLGSLKDLSEVADLKVTVVDVAAFNTGDGHFNVANSPTLIRLLSRITDVNAAFDSDQTGRTGLLPGVVLTVQSATQIILSPVTTIVGANVP